MSNGVGCWLQATTSHGYIGVIRLQRVTRRNSQTLAMVEQIHQQLDLWQADSSVVMLWLEGEGDHFCAGGDVLALAEAVSGWQQPGWCPAIVDFFAAEYRLMHRLRHWPRPVLAWGDGAVMGGGWGLFASARWRLVTERALLAMPEARIGLFPDVMASRFLLGLGEGVGLFAAMTAAQLGAADALVLGLASHALASSDRQLLFDRLLALPWRAAETDGALLDQLLHGWSQPPLPAARLLPLQPQMAALMTATSAADYLQQLLALESAESLWPQLQQRALQASPLSTALIWRQQQLASSSWAEIARRELDWAVQLCHHGDFVEGVRALLVDKGRAPRWRYQQADAERLIDQLWPSPWAASDHPLASLRG